MPLFTKDLLGSLLFLIIMCFVIKFTLRFFEKNLKLKKLIHTILRGISIICCTWFGVHLNSSIFLDLSQIPFILLCLIERPTIGILMLVFTILSRLILIGEIGVYATIITFSILTVAIFIIRPYFLKGNILQKFLICIMLSFTYSILMIISLIFLNNLQLKEVPIVYLLIPALCIGLIVFISDFADDYFHIKKQIIKAEKLQVVSHLAASFGHELRNPICVSKGFLQLLLEKEVSLEKRLVYARTALDELDHAESVIKDYLTFAKPQVVTKQTLDLQEEVKKAVEIVSAMANMNNNQIKFTKPTVITNRGMVVEGERNYLHQCLLNILKNGIEAMPKGGILSVEIFALEYTIGVRISDTGIGMSKDQIKHLGEPYFSLKQNGTGLGIMAAFNIVKSMKGQVKVESELGKGTVFSLLFPCLSSVLKEEKIG
ncbi:TPA: hypothetical protein VBX77_004154 [Yersinia enterocolitica]|nr:hypothetical protein [Yersinia enterocolitica]